MSAGARRTAIVLAVLAGSAMASPGFAQTATPPPANDRARAKDVYDQGVAAYQRGEYSAAAALFARADEIAPSASALQAALDSAVEADDPALGLELLERAKRAPATGSLATSIEEAKRKFSGRGGWIRVTCPASATECSATVDGKPMDTTKRAWAPVGSHAVAVTIDGATRTTTLDVPADDTVEAPVSNDAPDRPAGPVHSVPPVVFWAGVAATGVLGAMTTYFALDASGTHDDFLEAGCQSGMGNDPACAERRSDGERSETLTNVGLAATLVVGAATAVVGLFFVDWRNPRASGRSPFPGSFTLRRGAPTWQIAF